MDGDIGPSVLNGSSSKDRFRVILKIEVFGHLALKLCIFIGNFTIRKNIILD